MTSREIMAGDMSRRIPIGKQGDEIDEVAGNLNAMLDQIERLLAGMSQISDNIAHDLRTPISRLRTGLESALIGQSDPESDRKAMLKAIEEADNILKTFNALLNIAQAEAGATEAQFGSIDPTALLYDVAELYEPLAEEQGIALELDIPQKGDRVTDLKGDRNLLFQAVANLVDNALKFSPEKSRITIALETETAGKNSPRRIRIIVADQGPGIPGKDRERVLDRFHRLEASRSTPGNGLGLSLVSAVSKLHRGSLSLEDNGPGLRAVLTLPIA
jgi:signal transduction histidine kinase